MTRIRLFQLIVVVAVLMNIVWYFLPYFDPDLPPETVALLRASGMGASDVLSQPWFHGPLFTMRLIAAIGLFFLQSWGRWLSVFLLAVDLMSTLLSGVTVNLPRDSLVLALSWLLDGAVLVMAFSAPVSSAFEPMRKPLNRGGSPDAS